MMSKIEYSEDDKVIKRTGEFYPISSCYTTPRVIGKTTTDEWMYKAEHLVFWQLFSDVDELTNKPRRFFDHMLSLVEYMREQDPMVTEHEEDWAHLIKGCELWLCAVDQGLYGDAIRLSNRAKRRVKTAQTNA
jgi:hypothetical protein